MKNIDVTAIPDEYKKAAAKELRGTVTEVSYRVANYINRSRQLVTNRNISSAEVGRDTVEGDAIIKQCNVYLPAGYDENDPDTRYDVLYMLHGVGGNCEEWLQGSGEEGGNYIVCNLLDNLIANGDIDPLIVVFPDGRSTHDWHDRSFNPSGTNLLGFYYFDYELRYDLIPLIESTYKTKANIKEVSDEAIAYNRMHRAIAGLSMGGMQALNLGLGGYRCDSCVYTGRKGIWDNELDTTVRAPGMQDLFAYVGAFSNAPTSSEGKVLGSAIAASGRKLHLLYITCGTNDGISIQAGYEQAVGGLAEAAGDSLGDYYQILIKDGAHDFNVWNNGAYNFFRLVFRKEEEPREAKVVKMMLESY